MNPSLVHFHFFYHTSMYLLIPNDVAYNHISIYQWASTRLVGMSKWPRGAQSICLASTPQSLAVTITMWKSTGSRTKARFYEEWYTENRLNIIQLLLCFPHFQEPDTFFIHCSSKQEKKVHITVATVRPANWLVHIRSHFQCPKNVYVLLFICICQTLHESFSE